METVDQNAIKQILIDIHSKLDSLRSNPDLLETVSIRLEKLSTDNPVDSELFSELRKIWESIRHL